MRWSLLLLLASMAAAGASTTPEAEAPALSSPSPPPPAEPTQLADDAVKSVDGASEDLDSVQEAVVATSSSLTGADEAGPTATSSTSSAVSQPSNSLDEAGEQSEPLETPTATSSAVPDTAHSQPSSDLPTSSPPPPSSSYISSAPADTPSPSPSPSPVPSPDDAVPAVEHLPLTEVPPVPELLSFNEWRERYVVLPDPSLARRAKKTAQRTRQDAVGAGVAGARAAEYDGDGADLGSLFVKSDESGSSDGVPRAGDTAGDSAALARRSGRLEATEVPTSEESPSTQTSSQIQPLPNVGSGEPSDPLLHLKDRSNYAAFECAAMVHRSSRKSKGASAILVEKKDRYMLTPCSATPKFVDVELCDEIQIDTLVLANFEFFSSTFKHFKASCSVDYPGKPADWHDLGTFRARNVRGVQVFPVRNPHFCRYLRVDFLSHFGSEHYCPVSLLRVYGFTQLDAYRESERRKAKAIEEALAAADLIDEEQELQDRLDDALRVEVENLERIEPAAGGKNTTEAEEPAAPSPSPPSDAATDDDAAGHPRGPYPGATASPEVPTTLPADAPSAPSDLSSTSSSHTTPPRMSATSSPTVSESQAEATDTAEPEMPSEPPSRFASSPTVLASEGSPPSSSPTFTPSASPTASSEQDVLTSGDDRKREAPSPSVPGSASSSPTPPSPGQSPSSSSHSVVSPHNPSPSAAASSRTQMVTSAAPSSSPSSAAASNSTSAIVSSSSSAASVVSPSPSAVRHAPRNESHHYQHPPPARPPPVIPPPLHQQPQPGESIYGTIMKRLTSLEHNQTLSMHFIEAQSSMLREAFGRVEKRLNDIEGSRTRQEQSIRQALLDLESQRVELERERLDLAMQVTLLSEDVRLERRLTIVQLIALFLLFVFVGFTRGIPTSPFIHLASSHLERPPLPRKESKKQEEKPRMEREKEPEKKVDEDDLSGSEALRRGHRRALSTSHRQSGTSKRHTSLSKAGPRRHYGVGAPPSSSKPLSAIRNSRPFTPPMRHSSAPPEEPFPSAAALEAKEAARRRIFPQSARKPSPSQGYEFPRPSSAGKLGRTSGPTSLEGDLGGFEASLSSLQVNSRDRPMPFPSSHLAVGRSVLNPSTADEADTEPSDSPAPQMLLAGFAADDEGEEDADDMRVGLASPVSSSSNGTGFGAHGRSTMHDDGDERDYHTYSSADDDEVHPFSTVRPRSPPLRSSSPRTVSSAGAMRAYGRNGRPPRPHVRVRPATSQGIASPVEEDEKGKGREVDQVVQKEGGGETSPEASGLAIPVPEPSSTLPSPPPEPLVVKQEEEEGGA